MKEEFDKYSINNDYSSNVLDNNSSNGANEFDFDFYFLNKYLDSADEPFQFISVFSTIKDIVINKKYNFNIPILFDASCSGVQRC
jgi:DNA-directed RNA polymerase